MGADQTMIMAGAVVELLPSLRFRVELEDRRRVVAHPAAGSKLNFVRLRPGDRVEVELSPKDPTRGRILQTIQTRQNQAVSERETL